MAKKNKTTTKKKTTKTKQTGYTMKGNVPLLNQPGDVNFDSINAPQVQYEGIDPTNVDFNFDKINYDNIQADTLADRFMTTADYNMVDPAEIANEFGDVDREQRRLNSELSSELSLDAISTELQGLQNYTPAAAALKRETIAADNTFNTNERLRSLDAADAGLRTDLEAQRGRANAYASGGLPAGMSEKAYELGIRSRAADNAAASGFGVSSLAAAKASDLMSIGERIGLSQYGDSLLTNNIGARTSLLAPTKYSDAGSQVSAVPSFSAGQAAMAIASDANAGNITSRDALASRTQQEQFGTSLEQDTRKTNLEVQSSRDLNQAKLNLDASSANQAASIQTQSINADNSIRTQLAGAEITSTEKRFNADLKNNVATGNANRTFEASNINAGRALETAINNRAVKLEVDKTNTSVIFQDRQRIASEKFSSKQAAAANAAANARAAMSASASAAAIAAQREENAADREFQLQQQQTAYDIYQQQRQDGQNRQDAQIVGNMITKIPTIIAGIGAAGAAIDNWWSDDSSSGGSSLSSIPNFNIGGSVPDFDSKYVEY